MSALSTFFSSFSSVLYADSDASHAASEEKEVKEESFKANSAEADEGEPEEAAEEEEEEEPEDVMPAIQEECQETAKCKPLALHFAHCEEKVNAGKGYPHEDCVEEFMMHCVNECTAPKLFAKLK
ncbi:hypothetical protein K474DRAFT_1597224 [Panus rudis PR-1116 ss-1]|nr:hypothetical protein K474DRAFT_1597224 [Panus rudis PR-1116 ss-1]